MHALTEVLEPWDGELRLTNSRYTGSTSPCLTVVHTNQQQVSTHGCEEIAVSSPLPCRKVVTPEDA